MAEVKGHAAVLERLRALVAEKLLVAQVCRIFYTHLTY
jgi:hypothetical protein